MRLQHSIFVFLGQRHELLDRLLEFFSRLDAKSGFHQIPLDDESARICTFATPFGRYRFLRLPFGIASASEVFQKTMSQIFDAIPGVRVYVDDILIWAPTRKEHDERLRAVLSAARDAGLTLNVVKCEIGVTKIAFLGDVISDEGIQPSPADVSSVLNMPAPTDKLGIQRMLGVITTLEGFCQHWSEKCN